MSFLDPVLSWSLLLPSFFGILALSFIVTMISNLIYKFTTNQKEMKRLKDQIEGFRKQIKEAKDNPKKMMKLNNEAMQVNMQYMGKTLKPMLFTFIPIILLIGWMGANFNYEKLAPGEPLIVHANVRDGFSGNLTLVGETLTTKTVDAAIVTDKNGNIASFAVQGPAGAHDFTIFYQGNAYGGNNGTIVFGEPPKTQTFVGKGPIDSIAVEYPTIHPLGGVNIFGWYPGWLAIYIALSIGLSIGTRKLLRIY